MKEIVICDTNAVREAIMNGPYTTIYTPSMTLRKVSNEPSAKGGKWSVSMSKTIHSGVYLGSNIVKHI